MNTSGPIDCVPFSFLIPCRRPSAHDPTEILVKKFKSGNSPKSRMFERTLENRAAYQLIAISLTNAGWESHTAPENGKNALEHEVQPEDLLNDLIRITVTKTIGAQEEHFVLGSTMPFYFRPAAGPRGNIPAHATGITLQIIGQPKDDFTWVDPEELIAAKEKVLVTPATRDEGFAAMIRQAVALFEGNRGSDVFKPILGLI